MELESKEEPIAVRVATMEKANRTFETPRSTPPRSSIAADHAQPKSLAERLEEERAANYPRMRSER